MFGCKHHLIGEKCVLIRRQSPFCLARCQPSHGKLIQLTIPFNSAEATDPSYSQFFGGGMLQNHQYPTLGHCEFAARSRTRAQPKAVLQTRLVPACPILVWTASSCFPQPEPSKSAIYERSYRKQRQLKLERNASIQRIQLPSDCQVH